MAIIINIGTSTKDRYIQAHAANIESTGELYYIIFWDNGQQFKMAMDHNIGRLAIKAAANVPPEAYELEEYIDGAIDRHNNGFGDV